MSITIVKIQRKSGVRYKAIVKKSNTILKTKTFTKKTLAREWAKDLESNGERCEALGTNAARITFKTLADNHLDWRDNAGFKDIRNHKRLVKWWIDKIGHIVLIDIDDDIIRSHLRAYANTPTRDGALPAAATINLRKAAVSSVFKYALTEAREDFDRETDYGLKVNPVAVIKNRKLDNVRTRYLEDDERKALLKACEKSEWKKLHLLVTLATVTGARRSELLNLHWCDISFKDKTAILHDTKNGEKRVLPLPAPAIRELLKFAEVSKRLVFPSDIKKDTPFNFEKHWRKAIKESGIDVGSGKDKFVFHSLRHTAASTLVNAGIDLYVTGEILGHKSLASTQRYAHLNKERKALAADKAFGGF